MICIIRELTANAIAHGHAGRISVAGVLNGQVLDFSVKENGCGFCSANCPGPAEGHFGLAGVRERIERLGGTFTLESQPGEGSYARVSFRISSNDVED
jgi:signal transduction histidine kinase